jgi:hypothetical protein
MTAGPFVFKSVATLARATSFFADSARTLQTAIERAPSSSIYFHLHFALFRRHFTTSEFLNDFARWTRTTLADEALAELLAAVDPLELTSLRRARERLVATIGEYVGRMEFTPSVGYKQRFCFQEAVSFIYPTGASADDLSAFARAVRAAPVESVFYHFVVAPLLEKKGDNDFSIWLEAQGHAEAAARVRRLSPYSTDLYTLGDRIGDLLQ